MPTTMTLTQPLNTLDPRQYQSVEAGRIVEELEEAGVTTFRLGLILWVATARAEPILTRAR
jgi:hypothetical protein